MGCPIHDASLSIYHFGPWILIERQTGTFAGRGGLHWTTVEEKAMIELAWSIEPQLHEGVVRRAERG